MKTSTLLTIFLLGCIYQQVHSINSGGKSARIVGGTDAYSAQFPYSVAVYTQGSSGSFFCGGTLISNEWIVTAGHCADGALQFTIRLGSNTLSGTDPNRVTVATTQYFVHPEYNPMTLEHNIALIKLRMPVELTSYIQPIALPTNDIPIYAHLTAVGWGQINDATPELSDHLQYVSLITISNIECANVYGYQVSDDMVCAAGNYNEGTCLGDTGSPLIEHIYNPQSVRFAGVASFISGDGCDEPHPSGYTRVYLYLDWIANITSGVF
ncbi:hypothetical protein Zmor_015486 [Zophobas morio]|uniref:Peptidase S1 domain-containing protein n=1 Tax=Zophobas morio TaxID=2755281 RepID=A0AA38MH82_9CUCU|nr:hypothetical protein Zmor_015486 [Zophobas morio]